MRQESPGFERIPASPNAASSEGLMAGLQPCGDSRWAGPPHGPRPVGGLRPVTASPRSDDRGFALLIVLWSMVLLALLGTRIAASGRVEMQVATNLRNAATAEAAADAAVHEAVFHLLGAGWQRWLLEGRHHAALPEASVDYRVEDLAGRINVNTAWPELLAALLDKLGVLPDQAASLAAAIVDWRSPDQKARPRGAKAADYVAAGRSYGPPGAAFRDPRDLGDVLGMTPALLGLLLPHVSVWGEGDLDPAHAGPVARAAMAAVGIRASSSQGAGPESLTVAITAEAAGPAASRFTRFAIVQIALVPEDKPWRILVWATEA